MKTCKKCGADDRNSRGNCRPCANASNAAYRKSHPEKAKNSATAWRKANREKANARSVAWQKANPEKVKPKSAAYRAAHPEKIKAMQSAWRQSNPEKRCAYVSKSRAAKLNATPAWANAFKIKEFYYTAQMLGMHTGELYHVDHIVPLQSNLVCGLHCEANLQILEASQNTSKGNRHWPDMPQPAMEETRC